MLGVASCQKNEIHAIPEQISRVDDKVAIKDYDKLTKYLSISFGQDESKIKFDVGDQSFFVPNTKFKIPLSVVRVRYELANEYKIKFE